MIESGLTEHWKTLLWPATSYQCTATYRNREGSHSLTIRDIQSPFLILAVGSNFALLIFVIELTCYYAVKYFSFFAK